MNYNMLIARLYFLLVDADGDVNEKEVAIASQMVKEEGLNAEEFDVQLRILKTKDREAVFAESMIGLKQLSIRQQVRIVAWMCVIANADGFMDRGEWQLIYKIYHKELNLPLHEIFAVQKELNRKKWEKQSVIGL
ncbi:MAG TPA: TerB family tellurite resistance protein [Chryseosolibacter sp.]